MTSNYRPCSFLVWIAGILVAATTSFSRAAGNESESRPLFDSNQILRVQIEAPFTTVMRERNSEEYRDGQFHVMADADARQTFDLKLRARGNYRRDPTHCRFAPLRLNFSGKQLNGTLLEGQDKLKLVTHCQDRGSDYEQSVVLEYLAYRILNELTDLSFRVRLLHVDYIDTGDNNKTRSKYAFVIEDDEELSRRIGMQIEEVSSTGAERLDPRQAALISVFQYLIGNTDYSPVRGAANEFCCHNILLLRGTDGMLIPVAYDFDLSGLVDSPYASPNPALKINSVTERLYRGYCDYNDSLVESVDRIAGKRDAIANLLQSQEGLTKGSTRGALRFINKYYDRVSDQPDIERNLVRKCL